MMSSIDGKAKKIEKKIKMGLFFNKKDQSYEEVLKIVKDLQLKYGNLDVKMQELDSKIDFFKAELKQQRKKRLNLQDDDSMQEDAKDIYNNVLLPDHGHFHK